MARSAPRYLLYSHDTFGLGHFRRSTSIARGIVAADPTADVLIVTGSPVAGRFELPGHVDTLTLPAATKGPQGDYRSRRLGVDFSDLVRLRSAVLVAAVEQFRPDAVVVDHAPVGMAGELIPLLQRCSDRPGTRLVLGLRDIVDDAAATAEEWERCGVWHWLDAYDELLVYGDHKLVTTADELGLAERLTAPVSHVGYVAPPMPWANAAVPAEDRYVLVTAGGGGDGQLLVRRYLDAVAAGAVGATHSIVVTGPLMAAGDRAQLIEDAARLPHVELVEAVDDMRGLIASAAAVISMAGYNTVVEELAAAVPSLLVPRTEPRVEQELRARRIAPFAAAERCCAAQLTPERIADFVHRWVHGPIARVLPALDLGGAQAAARHLTDPGATAARPTPGPTLPPTQRPEELTRV